MSMEIIVILVLLCGSVAMAELLLVAEDDVYSQQGVDEEVADLIQSNVTSSKSCQPDMCQLLIKLGAMESRLAANERKAEQQGGAVTELRALVMEQASLLAQQKVIIEDEQEKQAQLSSTVAALTSRVQSLETEVRNQPQVAFSASMYTSGSKVFGPFSSDKTVVFRRVITNIGNAYNSATGIFTAPVPGVYYFTFTAFTTSSKRAYLRKNGQNIVSVTDHKDNEDSASNAAVLTLKKWDQVYLVLSGFSNSRHLLYDDPFHFTTFSGYLLFSQS